MPLIGIKKFTQFGTPGITEDEISAVSDVLRSGWLSTGNVSMQFEKEFESYTMSEHTAIAVNSCTMGIYLSLKAIGVGHGDEVILPPLTFCATLNAVIATGANPVLVDVKEDGQINEELVRKSITGKTKAIIPVDYTGSTCDFLLLSNIAKKNNIPIVEDAAHGFGGRYLMTTRKIGSMADFACFSFYPNKNITSAEGGMVLVKDHLMANKLRSMSMNGLNTDSWNRNANGNGYQVVTTGFKGNLPDVLAAIGLVQLRRWNKIHDKRLSIWREYEKNFGNKPMSHSTHLYTVLVNDRDLLREQMKEKGIGTGVHFRPLHLEPAYSYLGFVKGSFPIAERIGEMTISLPISTSMDGDDISNVIKTLRELRPEIIKDEN